MLTAIAIFLMVHGVVHLALASTPYSAGAPCWPSLWREWPGEGSALARLGMGRDAVRWIGGLLWPAAMILLVAAGVTLLTGAPEAAWRALATGGAAASLLMLILFWHPWLVVGLLVNFMILLTLHGSDWLAIG